MTIVMTTINVPSLLEGYGDNFAKYGHLDEVDCLIVGDRKTPHAEVRALCEKQSKRGFRCEYWDLEAQAEYMKRFPEMDALIPFNSDQRRNIAYLAAAERGVELLAAVDDDNYARDDDWFAAHAITGTRLKCKTVASASRWYNPCRQMETVPPVEVYPRGQPYGKRHLPDDNRWSESEGRVAVNAGLWLLDPDVDSLTRLTVNPRCPRITEPRVMCAPGTWAAINTQNTVFHRDTLPAFYFVPITGKVGGMVIERYGDIWAGFFLRKCIDQMDERVVYGIPGCDHKRNMHVLLKDLQLEYLAIQINEQLWEKLYDWKLSSRSYGGAYREIADHLERAEWPGVPMAEEVRGYFGHMAKAMRVWVATCEAIGYAKSA
jgi:hypothetical protein